MSKIGGRERLCRHTLHSEYPEFIPSCSPKSDWDCGGPEPEHVPGHPRGVQMDPDTMLGSTRSMASPDGIGRTASVALRQGSQSCLSFVERRSASMGSSEEQWEIEAVESFRAPAQPACRHPWTRVDRAESALVQVGRGYVGGISDRGSEGFAGISDRGAASCCFGHDACLVRHCYQATWLASRGQRLGLGIDKPRSIPNHDDPLPDLP